MGEVHMTVPPGIVAGPIPVNVPGTQRDSGEDNTRSHGMDGIRELLSAARDNGLVAGSFRGFLHIAIGRKITRPDGSTVSTGLTWRALAQELKNARFDQELVRELGADPDTLSPRDRERFWYSAIAMARVDSPEAVAAGDQLVPRLKNLGFIVGPPPSALAHHIPSKPKPQEIKVPAPKPKEKERKQAKKKKK
jgi:hypothetical protein